ncbi:hypothetical protein DNTS_028149 [Danionella cerebrum]|uniref:SAM-dependent methyltransferase RsmB-F/NOP2-type catalytic core domain-containing protein n=1 Tax=Danionella cerebrum TaxID=2873325 RepID=A0A553RF66_9TELE|nr:hypothetical protein DNTS_028149 [Danionella translucida]
MAAYISTRFYITKFKDTVRFIPRRYRVKTKWAATRPKFPATELAMSNFDKTYKAQYGDLWPSIRAAMLSEKKYGAVINNFSSAAGLISDLEAQGCKDFLTIECSKTDFHKSSQDPTRPLEECAEVEQIHLQQSITPGIKCLVFPKGDISRFKPARPDINRVLGYYLLDAASVLPALALDVQLGHSVLDLCAAPGGKMLVLLQSYSVNHLWANDSSISRINRLDQILQSYLPKDVLDEKHIHVLTKDGRDLGPSAEKCFDRIDTLQWAGIQATRPGGHTVYSTCSLSELQNECVVEQAVSAAQEELGITVQVQDLSWFAQHFSHTFCFAPHLRVGELVLPHLCSNFGPIYMCKLQRIN